MCLVIYRINPIAMNISNQLKHFWHVVSNVRPIWWICLYVSLVPVFALIYFWLPDSQFRIPDGGTADYSGWLYYSIVTITTLGFGDYTPQGHEAQWFTACEVILGLVVSGFFLNAVASMKSEIDIESEAEKQRRLHNTAELEKLQRNIPVWLHKLNQFLSYCYAVTTPAEKRKDAKTFNPDFKLEDMKEMNNPTGLAGEKSSRTAIDALMTYSASLSLYLDTMQSNIDLTLWPELLEDSFAFVANYQMTEPVGPNAEPTESLARYIKQNASIARKMEVLLTEIASKPSVLNSVGAN